MDTPRITDDEFRRFCEATTSSDAWQARHEAHMKRLDLQYDAATALHKYVTCSHYEHEAKQELLQLVLESMRVLANSRKDNAQ